MKDIISESVHSSGDMYDTKVMRAIDDQDENDIEDFETEYDTGDGEDELLYNLSVNGVYSEPEPERYFPKFFAEIGF